MYVRLFSCVPAAVAVVFCRGAVGAARDPVTVPPVRFPSGVSCQHVLQRHAEHPAVRREGQGHRQLARGERRARRTDGAGTAGGGGPAQGSAGAQQGEF